MYEYEVRVLFIHAYKYVSSLMYCTCTVLSDIIIIINIQLQSIYTLFTLDNHCVLSC